MGTRSGATCHKSVVNTKAGVDMWKSIMPMSTSPRHDDHEGDYLLKPAGSEIRILGAKSIKKGSHSFSTV
jgi:hypothetical protein